MLVPEDSVPTSTRAPVAVQVGASRLPFGGTTTSGGQAATEVPSCAVPCDSSAAAHDRVRATPLGTAMWSPETTVLELAPYVRVQTTPFLVPELRSPIVTVAPSAVQSWVKWPVGATGVGHASVDVPE